jgi:hypothetical protein
MYVKMPRHSGCLVRLSCALFAIIFVASLGGCAGVPESSMAKREAAPAASPGAQATGGVSNEMRMIVSQAYLTLEVADVEKAVQTLVETAKKYSGYVVSSGNYTVIRVEAAQLPGALQDIAGTGKVTRRELQEQDVTKQYSDTSLKLENAKAARARYLELLAKAEDVPAALQVEKELERLNGEITLLESDLGNLAHLTQYATINVTLQKKVTPGPLGWVFYGLYKVIEWLFVWQ